MTTTDKTTGEQVFLRTPYNYDRNAASDETGLSCPEETKAQQHFAEECDINTIVRRFGLTGELPQNVTMPLTGDFTNAVTDYQTALNMVREADNGFMQMPADVRSRFNNDPGQLLAFMEDPQNREEAQKLGLVVPKPTPAPTTQPAAANEPAPAPATK